jgi:uncharacterized membrane protein YecN with MAPEG domain
MSAGMIVMLISVTAALFLAVRGLKSHGLSFERKAGMAAAWVVIIVVLAFVLQRFAS